MTPFVVKRDRLDGRDLIFKAPNTTPRAVVDLRPWCSPVEDQLHLGSCVAQSVVGAYELLLNKKYPQLFVDLSRLYLYYNARLLEDMVQEDAGVYIRDGIKAANKFGLCKEEWWPYLIERFAQTPTSTCYIDGGHRLIKNYQRTNTINDIVSAVNMESPVVAGMQVYDSFFKLNDGSINTLPMPGDSEELVGGHAVTIVGYDLHKQFLLARNSFGADWGMAGYFWIPFEFARSEFMDCWTFDIKLI